MCVDCWNAVTKMHVKQSMISTPIGGKLFGNQSKCFFCLCRVKIGENNYNLSQTVVNSMKSYFKIVSVVNLSVLLKSSSHFFSKELTTENQICRACFNFVAKFTALRLMLQESTRIAGYWNNRKCRICESITNDGVIPRQFIAHLQAIFKVVGFKVGISFWLIVYYMFVFVSL